MNNPINFSFVTPFDISLNKEGEQLTLTVLRLDKDANEDYWKRHSSFASQINNLKLSGPEDALHWEMSTKFAEHPAVIDLVMEMFPYLEGKEEEMMGHTHEILGSMYGIPVQWLDREDEYLALVLKPKTEGGEPIVEVNTYW